MSSLWYALVSCTNYVVSKYLPCAMCCGGITLFDALTNHSLCFGARKESLGHCGPQCSDIFFAFFFIGCRYVVRAQIPFERVHCGLSDLIRGQEFAQCAHIGFAIRTIGASAQWNQIAKIRQKLDFKNSWNWLILIISATVWHILNMKSINWLETEIKWICWNLLGKICEIAACEFIFGVFQQIGPTWHRRRLARQFWIEAGKLSLQLLRIGKG